mmetsp:Transcript_16125/g.47678  ORF Transcript_16125/g.47678 Transcript_16125/m.47678 type:complete len:776 (-) Transcript_16125:110-2437(-)
MCANSSLTRRPSTSISARMSAGAAAAAAAAPAAAGREAAGPAEMPSERLVYGIHSCSSHSAAFHPSNILHDLPSDQTSRWSSGSNNPPQYIVLELEQPAVVSKIHFGKYEKQHVCNVKEFEVYGGLTLTNMTRLIRSGLKNDAIPEHFELPTVVSGVVMAVRFIKVVPLVAWGSRSAPFNFSIWHVALEGVADPAYVTHRIAEFEEMQHHEAVRLCLKYFRQRNFTDTFERLQKRTKISLEDPILTDLYSALVSSGDFAQAERLLLKALNGGVLSEYLSKFQYEPEWTLLRPERPDGTLQDRAETPGMRGGHQMCIDPSAGFIYLFGGWDGKNDLGDFWRYSIKHNRWDRLSTNTEDDGGPDARSCHKMVLDIAQQRLYVLGKYADARNHRHSPSNKLHCYSISDGTWSCLMEDTAACGGPELIYDHQMCLDAQSDAIYVFGGRKIVSEAPDSKLFSGLYRYDCETNTWELLREDRERGEEDVELSSRIGHSMLHDGGDDVLMIFAGQRDKKYLSDFYKVSLASGRVELVSEDCSKHGGPFPGFTQRATIDLQKREAYVLSGLIMSPDSESKASKVRNSLWVYDISRNKWYCAYENENSEPEYWNKMDKLEPCPRFAHQFVYDDLTKTHYLFGGNAGEVQGKHTRLSDFWKLQLNRPTLEAITSKCQYLIRRQQFRELCRGDLKKAMRFLQTDLSTAVDHSDPESEREFQALTASLFSMRGDETSAGGMTPFDERTALFEELIAYFPVHMKQPATNLVDLIKFSGKIDSAARSAK